MTKHIANIGDVEKMGMWELMKLAKSLEADADDAIRAAEQEERQLQGYSSKFPGFRGELEFDWTVAFLGQTATREAVLDAVDAKCKVEDADRRTAAKARRAKLTPRSKRRH